MHVSAHLLQFNIIRVQSANINKLSTVQKRSSTSCDEMQRIRAFSVGVHDRLRLADTGPRQLRYKMLIHGFTHSCNNTFLTKRVHDEQQFLLSIELRSRHSRVHVTTNNKVPRTRLSSSEASSTS